ncbi:MAG: large subunit ribosomal protein [Clostridiales bacterium]|jgi:large subunit ribosomal protein L17|uniref:bL17 family ribosomal protein n=1 Tax=Caldicoprobacter algeriensis TaxID=699281 RepID=UPI00207935FE|nr:bL17 family ribosomal protein [Caldicoprobacter algeriensis]MCM8900358.1 50S ribosomal protein L17 [Caldicoprobacter algeriensis]MDN5277670.1 large subunit ribosomal protein [Clostridiales bacterium]
MAKQRKLGKPSDQRRALLRNQVSALLWHGKIVTTEARAKEVRRIAEKLIHLAVEEYDKTVKVQKEVNNEKGQTVTIEVTNDAPSKLNARRKMMAFLYDLREPKSREETKKEYKQRMREIKHPLIEKLFNEYGPKYRARNQEKNCAGGYTRIIKLGPRRGDGAEQVLIELVD